MANNRMYLVCLRCAQDADTSVDQCVLRLAKYYSSAGWYPAQEMLPIETELPTELPKFLQTHSHKSLFGDDIRLLYEDELFDDAKRKHDLVRVAGDTLRRSIEHSKPSGEV